jgi:cell wall-associated NlpC family hydrolase
LGAPPEDRYTWIKRQDPALEPRFTLARPDVAEAALEGSVAAERFVTPKKRTIAVPLADLKREPQPSARLLTQALMGETAEVVAEKNGWAFARLLADGYVGYLRSEALSPHFPAPTHRVAVPLSHIYAKPDLKTAGPVALPFLARIAAGGAGALNGFVEAKGQGWVFAKHLKPLAETISDPVETALSFLHAPYLWGGRSALGLDCSALVQLALQAAGIACPRDTDRQREMLGTWVPKDAKPAECRRGDLVFFPGHVGILIDETRIVHANATRMKVSIDAVETVASWLRGKVAEPILGVRRL